MLGTLIVGDSQPKYGGSLQSITSASKVVKMRDNSPNVLAGEQKHVFLS